MLRRSACFAVFAFLLLGGLAAPASAQYGGTGTVALSKTTFAPGETGTGTLSNAIPETTYDVDFAQSPGVLIGNATTTATGAGTVTFKIPTTANVGSATLTFDPRGTDSGNIISPITISGSTTPVSDVPTLPTTGAEAAHLGVTGLTLLALGTVLLLAVRRRSVPAPDGPRDLIWNPVVARGWSASHFDKRT